MTQRELWIMGLAFGVGYKLKEYFVSKEVERLEKGWAKINQDVTLQMGALTAIMNLLEEGELEAAQEFWNEHVEFMKQIDNF